MKSSTRDNRHTPTIEILGVPLTSLDLAGALAELEGLYYKNAPSSVFYINAHTLNLAYTNPEYRAVLRRADIVLNDGIGVSIAARMHGQRFLDNLNGSDFNPLILTLAAKHGWRCFFLGARPGVAKRAANQLKSLIANLNVVGHHHGYFSSAETPKIISEIQASGAEVLMVAMGNPLQELWLDKYLSQTGARLGVGVGAFFDFASGEVSRCPQWMNRLGIEWLYRLYGEPRRLWRRYLVGNPIFLARVTMEWLASR